MALYRILLDLRGLFRNYQQKSSFKFEYKFIFETIYNASINAWTDYFCVAILALFVGKLGMSVKSHTCACICFSYLKRVITLNVRMP